MTAGTGRGAKKAPAAKRANKRPSRATSELARLEAQLREQLIAPNPAFDAAVQNMEQMRQQLAASSPAFERMRQQVQELQQQLRRELEEAEEQVPVLLRLGDTPLQYAVDYLKANPPSATTILLLIAAAGRAAVSDKNRDRARKRNLDTRAAVIAAWDSRRDPRQSKNSFAREWEARLSKTDAHVKAETIADRWLKGR